ncbi:MAG: ATP-binding protein, partial [Methylobacter sp.]
FAFYFAPPIFSFAISDLQNIVSLTVMIVVANLTSNLQDKAHQQADLAYLRELRANALYRLSLDLADISDPYAVAGVAVKHIYEQFGVRSVLLFANDQGELAYPGAEPLPYSLQGVDLEEAKNTCQPEKMESLNNESLIYRPLFRSQTLVAVLAIENKMTSTASVFHLNEFFDTFYSLIAQSLERLHFAEQAKSATLQAETESLRNALLSVISHDLRTPLTRITGAAGALLESGEECSVEEKQDLGKVIFDEARRMSDLTSKILNMARLSRGEIVLHQDWNAIEEIVGSALTRLDSSLKDRPVRTQLQTSLPLTWMDAVLMEQVLINLIENAIKYTPPGSPIDISAEKQAGNMQLVVSDYGSGIPKGMEEKLFEKFYSLETETQEASIGLGLALCRSIIEAHGGSIHATNIMGKGAAFIIELPLREPPTLSWNEAETGVV